MAEEPTTETPSAAREASGDRDPSDPPVPTESGGLTRHRVGTAIGPYRLIRVIGQGAMATVFEAEHSLIGRHVAIKVLCEEAAENPTAVARFFQEAQAINRLRHPGIIEITDVAEGSMEHAPFMVMELFEGVPLNRVISARRTMTPTRVADIGRQICDALGAVHKAGIVHRDLKPENVLVIIGPSQTPRIKLLDFGVAKFLATEENAMRTRTGAIVGTPEYMTPEQVRGQPVDTRTDIYALGCMLYEMLTGTRPFQAEQLGELLRQQLQHHPPRPSEAVREPSDGGRVRHFDHLVLACLEKDPARRPQTMAEVAQGLAAAQAAAEADGTGALEDISAQREEIPPPQRRPSGDRRWPPWATATAALVTVAAGFALWLGSRPGRPHSTPPRQASQKMSPLGVDVALSSPTTKPRPEPRRPSAPPALTLATTPVGAAVYDATDGRFLGNTPLALGRPAKDQPLLVRSLGHREERIVLRPDAPEVVAIELSRDEPVIGRPTGTSPHRPAPMPPDPMPPKHPPGEWGTVDPFEPMTRP